MWLSRSGIILISGLLVLAAAVSPAQAARLPKPADDLDLRCVAAVSFALGAAGEKAIDAEGLSGLAAVFMYYLGKVDSRRPGLDYAKELPALMTVPGYEKQLSGDLARCGKEAELRGAMLRQLGDELKRFAPPTAL